MNFIIRFLATALFVFVLACSGSGTGLNLVSYDQEAQLGSQYATEVERQYPMLNDPWLDNYVANLGRFMITKGVPDPKFEYEFKVVNSPEVNAFAIPGGHLFVNVGLLKAATTEAELVGVWGHEIGHVVLRHGTKRLSDAMLLQTLAGLSAEATKGRLGENSQYVGLGVLLFGQGGLLKYGRNAELEADQFGINMLYATNYDGNALAGFFRKLLKIEQEHGVSSSGLSQLFATHPPTQERIDRAEALVHQRGPQQNPIEVTEAFQEMKTRVASINPPKPKPQNQPGR